MRRQTLIVVALALGLGGLAAAGVFLFSDNGGARSESTELIVVAKADVPRGDSLSADSVEARPYPRGAMPSGYLRKVEDAIGRAALIPFVKDEPVMETKLAPKGAGRGLAALVKKGMRAITVQTPNVATGVGGFIVPGNHVDVVLALNDSGRQEKDGLGATTLLEDVEILAVDQKVDAPAENRVDAAQMRSVTLSVTPEQAAKLSAGLTRGTIHLSLRNPGDDGRMPPPPPPAPPAPPPAPPPEPVAPTVRTIRTLRGVREGVIQLEPAPAPLR